MKIEKEKDICRKCGHDAVNHFDENGRLTRCKYILLNWDTAFPKSSRYCDCPDFVRNKELIENEK